jgi:bla regulator protein BlaR1
MVYATTFSAALGLLGLCHEKLAAMSGRPRRIFWAVAMVLSLLWPLGAILWNEQAPAATPAALTVADPQPLPLPAPAHSPRAAVDVAASNAPTHAGNETPSRGPILQPPSDRTLLVTWAWISGVILLYLASVNLSLRHRASGWIRMTILDRSVQVSESTGPALIGALRPRIVVPRWFLQEPATTQSLILAHEQQHIAARDPLLLQAALIFVVALPWNLPLWWQLRRLRQAIELDCDARVLRAGAEADDYGKVLLAVTQRAENLPVAAIAMSEPVSALERRIGNLAARPARNAAPWAVAVLALWGVGFGAAFSVEAPAISAPGPTPAPAATPEPSAEPSTAAAAPVAIAPASATRPSVSTPPAPAAKASPLTAQPAWSPDLQRRMDVVTGGASATYGSGAMAGVVNKVLNDRLKGLQLERPREGVPAFTVPAISATVIAAAQTAPLAPQPVGESLMGAEAKPPAAPPSTLPAHKMDLRDLITLAGGKFRKSFVIDPRIQGTVDLGTLAAESLTYHAFLEILGVNGFAAVPSGDIVKIIPEASARTAASPIMSADNIQGDDAEIVTVLISLSGYQPAGKEGTKAAELAATLRALVSQSGQISPTPDGNSLLLVDRVGNAKRIVALVKSLSKPQ